MRKKIIGFALCAMLFALCLPAKAQQPKKVSRIGFVSPSSFATAGPRLEAFQKGLRDLGYVEGMNIAIETRWAEGSAERLPDLIAELIRLKVDVLVVGSAAGALAAKNARTTIPVVFAAVTDPFAIISSLARPGGNITGVSLAVGDEFSGKWVELLKETVPKVARASVLGNPTHPIAQVFLRETQAAGRGLGLRLQFFEARDPSQLDNALSRMEKERSGALLVTPDPLFSSQQRRIVDFAAQRRLPSMFFPGTLSIPGASWPTGRAFPTHIGAPRLT